MKIKEYRALYPLTHPQRRIWNSEIMHPQSGIIVASMETEQAVDFTVLESVIHQFIHHQDAFRIRLTRDQGEVKQYFHSDQHQVPIAVIDLKSQSDVEELASRKEAFQVEMIECELFKFYFYQIGPRRGLVAKIHHIITDGWSFLSFLDYVWNEYQRGISNEGDRKLPSGGAVPKGSYLSYIEKEQQYLGSKRFKKNESYWLNIFNPIPEHMPAQKLSIAAGRSLFVLDEVRDAGIRRFVQERGQSLQSFFMTLFYIYIRRIEQSGDLVIGSPVFNRSGQIEREMFGMCTSTMPVRLNSSPNQSVGELFTYVAAELKRCYYNQKYPYDLLIPALRNNNPSLNQLYHYSVNYLNYPLISELNGIPILLNWHHSGRQEESLALTVREHHENKLSIIYDYKIELYSEQEIHLIHERMKRIIDQVLFSSSLALKDIEIMSVEERKRMNDFNDTYRTYPSERTIVSLLEDQVDRSPNLVAVVYQEQKLTYRELNMRANRLAHSLRAEGVGAGSVVAIMTDRSLDMLAGICGILKAGGAYLPLDPSYPQDRISYILEDSNVKLVLGESRLSSQLPVGVDLCIIHDDSLQKFESTNPDPVNKSSDLAYIIYTSGSTGKPKGVMLEHRNVHNLIMGMKERVSYQEGLRVLSLSTYGFDIFVLESLLPLITGACILLASEEEQNDSERLLDLMIRERAQLIHATPSRLQLLLEVQQSEVWSGFKAILLGICVNITLNTEPAT